MKKGFFSNSVVKSLPANVGAVGDASLISGPGGSPGGRHGNPLSTLAWRIPWTEEPGGLQSMGLQTQSDTTERTHTCNSRYDFFYTFSFTKHTKFFNVTSHWNLYCKKTKGPRGQVCCLGPHRLSVVESALNPAQGTQRHQLFLPPRLLSPGGPPLLKLSFILRVISHPACSR